MTKQQVKPSIQNVVNRFNAYNVAVAECEAADKAWENELSSEELESAFDDAYSKQSKAFNRLVGAVIGFTDGKIGRTDVQSLIAFRPDEFIELVESAA